MQRIEWDQKLTLGIEPIDFQHQKLLFILNDLIDIINASQPVNRLEEIIHRMVTYAKAHFGAEEKLMRKSGYSNLKQHEKQHKLFIMKILEINENYNPYNATLRSSLLEFLSKWYINHIGREDRDYVASIKKLPIETVEYIVAEFDPPETPPFEEQ